MPISKVKKYITRKLNTAQYETVDLHCEIEDEIDWKDEEDKLNQIEKSTRILILDFQRTLVKVLEELKLEHKLAIVTHYNSENTNISQNANITQNKKDNKIEISKEDKESLGDFDFLK